VTHIQPVGGGMGFKGVVCHGNPFMPVEHAILITIICSGCFAKVIGQAMLCQPPFQLIVALSFTHRRWGVRGGVKRSQALKFQRNSIFRFLNINNYVLLKIYVLQSNQTA